MLKKSQRHPHRIQLIGVLFSHRQPEDFHFQESALSLDPPLWDPSHLQAEPSRWNPAVGTVCGQSEPIQDPRDGNEGRWRRGKETGASVVSVGTSPAEDAQVRPMPQPRCRLLSQRTQETLPVERVHLHQLPPGGGASESHGSPGRPQKVPLNPNNYSII